MHFIFKAVVISDPFGSFVAFFDEVPEAIGQGDDAETALKDATSALTGILERRLREGLAIPEPKSTEGIDVVINLDDSVMTERRKRM